MLKLLPIVVGLLAMPAAAETLKIGRAAGAPSLGNPFTTVGAPSGGVWLAMFDALTVVGESGTLEPALAVSWRANGPTQWTFDLRPNVRFHDGAPFDADSVADVFRWLRSDDGRRTYVGGEVAGIVDVSAAGPLKIEVTTKAPDPLLPKRMSLVSIVAPHAWRTMGAEAFARAPVGTGPFRLVKFDAERMAFERAPSWRAADHISRLEVAIIPDGAARLQALLSGAVDLIEGLSPDDAAVVTEAGFAVKAFPTPAVLTLAFRNVGNPSSPVQDRRVREAINLAIDRGAMVRTIAGDERLMVNQGTVAGVVGFEAALGPIPFDPTRAKTLLADAGYASGFDLAMEVTAGAGAAERAIYQKVAEDLRNVGVRVSLREIPFPTWLGRYLQNDWGKTDVFSFMWDASLFHDIIRPVRNSSCARANPFFCLPEVMPLIDDSERDMDPTRRDAKVRGIARQMRDAWGAIWLMQSVAHVAHRQGLGNLRLRAAGIEYEKIELARRASNRARINLGSE